MADREVVAASVDVHQGVAHTDVGHVWVHTDVRRGTLEPQPVRSPRPEAPCKTNLEDARCSEKSLSLYARAYRQVISRVPGARAKSLVTTGLHLIFVLLLPCCEARLLGGVHTTTKHVLQSTM